MWVTLIVLFIMIVYSHYRISRVEEKIKGERNRLEMQIDKTVHFMEEVEKKIDKVSSKLRDQKGNLSIRLDDVEDTLKELSFQVNDIEYNTSIQTNSREKEQKPQKIIPSKYQVDQEYADNLYEKIRNFKAHKKNGLGVLEAIFSSFPTLHLKEGYILDVKVTEESGVNNIPYIRKENTKRGFKFMESFHLIESDGSKYSWFELALCFFMVNKCFYLTWHDGAYNDQPAITKLQWEKLANFKKYKDAERANITNYDKFNTIQILENGIVIVNMLTYSNSLDVNDATFTIHPDHTIELEEKNFIHSINILF